MNFKKILSYSAIESIGSRVFDFATLWIVLNTLNTEDIAKFGLATSSIFMFNLIFLAPETALFKYQKQWFKDDVLQNYLSSFVSFSVLKIGLHYFTVFCLYTYYGELNWIAFAVLFSAITQQIQAAEISRIFHRMELFQKDVARFEVFSKFLLMIVCASLFFEPSIELYFLIYIMWSISVSLLWLNRLHKKCQISLSYSKKNACLILQTVKGYSLWTHISGVMTTYLYNGGILFLGWLSFSHSDIASYTVVNKITNLFFVIPMFFQSFVPVVLANDQNADSSGFVKILKASGCLSLAQLVLYMLFGNWLGLFFGVRAGEDLNNFYLLGLIISFGIFVLNISRPLSTYILVKGNPRKLMLSVFTPVVIIATLLYPLSIYTWGVYGAAYSSAIIYLLLAILLFLQFKLLRHN